jgi:DNA-binding SARP family transcriptional activator/predicted ATPase
MSLKIYLLGQFKILAHSQLLEIPSRPAQSLFAYLTMHPGITQRRERLASLLWPETNESNARSYLRQALWRLRKALESGGLNSEDFLLISNINVTFHAEGEYWLDAKQLLKGDERKPLDELIEIVDLYRGELLPGFYDEWVLSERERLQAAYHQKMNLLLERLIEAGEWETALEWSERWIQLGNAPEPAFRAMFRAYAGLGNLGMVSATYQRCVESMQRELGLEPSPETQHLYEFICRGGLEEVRKKSAVITDIPEHIPPFLNETGAQDTEQIVFVARQHELELLDGYLNQALNGQTRVVFVIGEAGAGKTALLQEFTRRTQEMHAELIVVSGNCNAYTGIGDPYLPFREILELLTGDVEARWIAGAMTSTQAYRLWNTLPLTISALVEAGPDLIDTFVPHNALLERALVYAPGGSNWLNRLKEMLERKLDAPIGLSPRQNALFDQYTQIIQALTRQVPIVMVLDDLQWADLGSINLLFHLGRQMAGNRFLILGAYRPEDVAIGRDGERHPLEPVINQFKRDFGDVIINLEKTERREFVAALLDSEPNQLGDSFRQMLYSQTGGHPLFTVELLRGMQERDDLIRDDQGFWVEGSDLDWEVLPARVEAVIAERIGRLSETLKESLRVASVEGETFTVEVVAGLRSIEERTLLGYLSKELDRKHRLVKAQSIERRGKRRISRFRFRNDLFQQYLYDSLDDVERCYLHEDVGNLLEELYGDRTSEIAVKLAWHYQEAGIYEKAIDYLHQAGKRAVQLSAYREAISHMNRGLELLMSLPKSSERAQKELDLLITMGVAWKWGVPDPEGEKTVNKARKLCQQIGKTDQLSQVLGEMLIYCYVRAEYQKALELGQEALSLAEEAGDPLLLALGHWQLGFVLFGFGEFTQAHHHLTQVISFYKPKVHHHSFVFLRGADPGVGAFAYDACCLWCLGYLDQANQRSQQALEMARELNHTFTLVDVLSYGGCLFNQLSRDAVSQKQFAKQVLHVAQEFRFPSFLGTGNCYYGDALIKLGDVAEGITQLQIGVADRLRIGVRLNLSGLLAGLVEANILARQYQDGFENLTSAFVLLEKSDERYYEAELHRLQGELFFLEGDREAAEACFKEAIDVARGQDARSWELRATTSLARLLQEQGQKEKAHRMLTQIYTWFTEGFDSPDLKDAQVLLEELS